MDSNECEVACRLDGASLSAVIGEQREIFHWGLYVFLLAWPLECIGPSEVAEPCEYSLA